MGDLPARPYQQPSISFSFPDLAPCAQTRLSFSQKTTWIWPRLRRCLRALLIFALTSELDLVEITNLGRGCGAPRTCSLVLVSSGGFDLESWEQDSSQSVRLCEIGFAGDAKSASGVFKRLLLSLGASWVPATVLEVSMLFTTGSGSHATVTWISGIEDSEGLWAK